MPTDVTLEEIGWAFHPDRDRWNRLGVTDWAAVEALQAGGLDPEQAHTQRKRRVHHLITSEFSQDARVAQRSHHVLDRFLDERSAWADLGFSTAETVGWLIVAGLALRSVGPMLERWDAARWRDAGFGPAEACLWIVDLDERVGHYAFNTTQAAQWRNHGIGPGQARQVVNRFGWVRPSNVDRTTSTPKRLPRVGRLWRIPAKTWVTASNHARWS